MDFFCRFDDETSRPIRAYIVTPFVWPNVIRDNFMGGDADWWELSKLRPSHLENFKDAIRSK